MMCLSVMSFKGIKGDRLLLREVFLTRSKEGKTKRGLGEKLGVRGREEV